MATIPSYDLFVHVQSQERWDYLSTADLVDAGGFRLFADKVFDGNRGAVRWDYEARVVARWLDMGGNVILRTIDGDTIALIVSAERGREA